MQLLAQTTSTYPDSSGVGAALAAMSGMALLIGLVFVVITVLIYYFIVKRTGMNPWLSLLMLVPIANFVLLLMLAFSEWPVQRENRALRAQLAGAGGGVYPGGGYPPAGGNPPPSGPPVAPI